MLLGIGITICGLSRGIASRTWTLEQFGGSGNGVADSTAATLAFNAAAVALPNVRHVLNLQPGGHYLLDDASWVQNIRYLTVNGPAILENPVQGTPIQPAVPFVLVPIVLIDDAQSGNLTVTALTPSEAGGFSAGEWVLIGCNEQYYSGQPASMRFFEFNEIASVNAVTGAIVLRNPLENDYGKNRPYTTTWSPRYGDGRAAVFKIENQALWNVDQTYNDIEFRAPAGVPPVVYMTCRRFTANRCSIAGNFLASWAGDVRLNDCQTTIYQFEIDKCIKSLELNGCTIAEIVTAGTSCKSLIVRNSTLNGGARVNAKSIEFIDTDLVGGALEVWNVAGFCDSLTISGGSAAAYPFMTTAASQMRIVEVGSDGASWDGSTLTLSDFVTNGTAGWLAVAYPGRPVHVVVVPPDPNAWPTGVAGFVTSVTGSDGIAEIAIAFNSTVSSGDKLALLAEPYTTDISNLTIGSNIVSGSAVTWLDALVLTDYLKPFGFTSHRVLGIPSRVEVNVRRAYTGPSSGNTYLQIAENQPTSSTRLLRTVNLRTTGLRVATFNSNSGWSGTGGESAAMNLAFNDFLNGAVSLISLGGEGYETVDEALWPIIDLRIEFDNPYKAP